MIIHNGQVITKILYNVQDITDSRIYDKEGNILKDVNDIILKYSNKISGNISAIYKGSNLIWATTYELSIMSCYGSGTWLDDYNWAEDLWKD